MIEADSCLINNQECAYELKGEREIPLRHSLFYNDALVFENLRSRRVKVLNKATGRGRGDGFLPVPHAGHLVRQKRRPLRVPGALDRLCHPYHRGGRLRGQEGHDPAGPRGKSGVQSSPWPSCDHGLEASCRSGSTRTRWITASTSLIYGRSSSCSTARWARPSKPGSGAAPAWGRSWPTWPSTCWAWRRSSTSTWAPEVRAEDGDQPPPALRRGGRRLAAPGRGQLSKRGEAAASPPFFARADLYQTSPFPPQRGRICKTSKIPGENSALCRGLFFKNLFPFLERPL